LLNDYKLGDYFPTDGIFSGFNEMQDDRGFDFDLGKKQLEYNKPLWGGNLRLFGSPDQSGILYSKEWGV